MSDQCATSEISSGTVVEDVANSFAYAPVWNDCLTNSSEETRLFYQGVIEEYTTTVKLEPAEMALLKSTKSLRDVLDYVESIRQSREQRKKHRITRFLQRFVGGILRRFDRFSAVIETLVSSHADIPALVWGSVKLVLMVKPVSEYADHLDLQRYQRYI